MTAALAACTSALEPTVAPTASPTLEPTASPSPFPTPTPSPTPIPTPVPTPTPIPLDQGLLDRRLTILFIGKDSNPQRRATGETVNTDAMVVVSVAATYDRVDMVALPRDTVDIPLGDGQVWTGKLNSIYWHRGPDALRQAMSATLAIPIDYYVAIDMGDFGSLINEVGGVSVLVPRAISDPTTGLFVEPGAQPLDGNDALRYARTRKQDGDYARGARHMQLLQALADKLRSGDTDVDLAAVLGSLGSLETNLPLEKVPTIYEILRRTAPVHESAMVLGPPRFAIFQGLDGPRGWVMIPNIGEMRAYVGSVMRD